MLFRFIACLFLFLFLGVFSVSWVSLMTYLLVGHFEHKGVKKGKCKVDWTLKFFNDLELCACLVWVT